MEKIKYIVKRTYTYYLGVPCDQFERYICVPISALGQESECVTSDAAYLFDDSMCDSKYKSGLYERKINDLKCRYIQNVLPVMSVSTARDYAIKCHRDTNHKYDKTKPYEVHLQMVFDTAVKFSYLLPVDERQDILDACWCHDVIEDCRQTYNDVKQATNGRVAEIVYAVTNEKGKNRAERGNEKYYEGIRNTPGACFVKLCDRIANYTYSKENGSSMRKKYDEEHAKFTAHFPSNVINNTLIAHLNQIVSDK